MVPDLRGEQERRNDNRADTTGVIDSIRAIAKSLRNGTRDTEQRLGVTSAQLNVLHELRDNSASINELAARTYTHQSSVSMVVARLVDQKLVTRSAARGDARKLSISLTSSGRNLLRRSPDAAQGRLVSALRKMPRADLKELSAQLLSLVRIMEAQDKTEKLQYSRRSSATA